MRFSCDKSVLEGALDTVSKTCEKNSMEVLEGVLIEVKDGIVSLTCSNIITSIMSKFSVLDFENGSVVVNTKFLLDYVKKLGTNELIFERKDGESKVSMKCGRSKIHIAFMNAEDFPKTKIDTNTDTPSKVLSCNLKQALRETTFSIAQDETRPILTGVSIEVKESNLILAALDGYRLSTCAVPISSKKDFSCVIPGKTAAQLQKIITDEETSIDIFCNDRNIVFKFDNTVIYSSTLEGKFIEYNKIIPEDNNIIFKVKRSELAESLKRVAVVAESNSSAKLVILSIKVETNTIEIKSSNKVGETTDELGITESSGCDLEIAFNIQYLLDILNAIDEDILIFKLKTAVSPILIQKTESQNFLGLVLPVRLNSTVS